MKTTKHTDITAEIEALRDTLIETTVKRVAGKPNSNYDDAYNGFVSRVNKIVEQALHTQREEIVKSLLPKGATDGTVMYKLNGKVMSYKISNLLNELK